MSWLSKTTGVHISKHGVHIEPVKALGTALTIGSVGGLGPLAGISGKIGSVASHIPGAAKAGAVLGGLKKIGQHTPQAVGGPQGAIDMATAGDEGGFMGGLKKVGGFLSDHGDQLLGGAALGEGYLNQRKSNNLSNEALNLARQSYADRAGLRKLGVSQMLDQTAPDLSSTFADPNNPYAKMRRVG